MTVDLPPYPYRREKKTDTRREAYTFDILKNEHYFRSPYRKEVDVDWEGQLVEAYIILNIKPFLGFLGKVEKVLVNGVEAELGQGPAALRAYCTKQLQRGRNIVEVYFRQNPVPFLPSGWGRWQLVVTAERVVEYEVYIPPTEEELEKWRAEVREKTLPRIVGLELDYEPKKEVYKAGETITVHFRFRVEIPDPEHTHVIQKPTIYPTVTVKQLWAEVLETNGSPLGTTPPLHSQTHWGFPPNPNGVNEGLMTLRLWAPLRGTREVKITLSYFFPFYFERPGYHSWIESVSGSHELVVKVEGPVETVAEVDVENLNLKWGDKVKITVKDPRFIFADGSVMEAKFDDGTLWIDVGPHVKNVVAKFSDDRREIRIESPPLEWAISRIEPQNERIDDAVKIRVAIYQGPPMGKFEGWHELNISQYFIQYIKVAIYRSDAWPGTSPFRKTWSDTAEPQPIEPPSKTIGLMTTVESEEDEQEYPQIWDLIKDYMRRVIRDEAPVSIDPFITKLIITLNVLAFTFTAMNLDYMISWLGLTPVKLLAGEYWLLFTSMYLHADFLAHLGMNMTFLFVFGDNVEEKAMWRYLPYYHLWGVAAGLAYVVHALLAPELLYVPAVGASGAVSGVIGYYVVHFPKNKIVFLGREMPAMAFGLLFLAEQVTLAFSMSNIAWSAHLGGLLAGMATAWAEKNVEAREV